MTRSDLIAKLEAAEGASRELDAEIALAAGLVPGDAFRMFNAGDAGLFGTGAHTSWSAPAFTSSLDAGRTLLLPGWECLISSLEKRVEIYAKLGDGTWYDVIAMAEAKAVENAFAAAALRARGEG